MRPKDGELTPKQRRACLNYLNGMPLYKALLEAGYEESYSLKNCTTFFRKRNIIKFIREEINKREQAARVDNVYFLLRVKEIADSNDLKTASEALKVLSGHLRWRAEIEERLERYERSLKNKEENSKEEEKEININISIVEEEKEEKEEDGN